MFEILKSFIYGLVEGITEWLPISSTGHLILVEELLPFKETSQDFFSMFEVVIQLGAIIAVVLMFWKQIWPFAFSKTEPMNQKGLMSYVKMDIMELWFKIIVACIPAVVFVIVGLDEICEKMFYKPVPIAIALIVVGIAFIIVENRNKNRNSRINSLSDITYKTAVIVGMFQLIAAIFPGTSRSGATIIGALMIGVSRSVAAEFTFFLAIPVMFGASLLKILDFGFNFTTLEMTVLLVGTITSFVVSLFVLKFLMGYIKKHDFKIFGWYRIVLGVLVLGYFLIAGL
jgi:undecaprenyl-diphosphatase